MAITQQPDLGLSPFQPADSSVTETPFCPPTQFRTRNFFAHVLDGVFFMGGLAFTSTEIVLSVLVYQLGGSEFAIGCVFALTELGVALPQLLTAPISDGLKQKKYWVLCGGFLQRLPWLALALIFLHLPVPNDGSFVLLLLGLVTVSFLFSGAMGPAWSEFVASTVPYTLRGRMFALRQGLTGIIGLTAGGIVSYIIAYYPFPYNYANLFSITFSFWMLSLLCLAFVKEGVNRYRVHPSYSFYFTRHIPSILRHDQDFRGFLLLKAGMLCSMMSFGFYSVYTIQHFELPASTAGFFIMLYMLGQVICSFLFGMIADRFGHRTNVVIFCGLILLQNALVLFAPSLDFYYPIFFFLGAIRSIQIITFVSMPMEYADSRDRPTYYALSHTLLSPFYLSGMLGGILIGCIGYHGLFTVSMTFSVLTMLIVLLLIREPRTIRQQAY